MPLEAWMLRTVLVILAVNGVNIVLFWIARQMRGNLGAGGRPARVQPLSTRTARATRQSSARTARYPAHLRARANLRRGGLDVVRLMRNAVTRSAGVSLRTNSHAPGH